MTAPAGFVGALAAWSAGARRALPWRATRDPWAVLVAETMLQQTQVARVAERWLAFLDRFPDPAAAAAAGPAALIGAWSGLGYNRRAVALHRAALRVVSEHGGEVPDDLAALLALPGVGPYTARAVLAFAFERDVAVVDVNVARVLARAVSGVALGPAAAQRLADGLVAPGTGWAHNQAMLDLGAMHCRARPRCASCPLAVHCAWAGVGAVGADPAGTAPGQTRFAGSDRQGRGRLVARLRAGPIDGAHLAEAAGWPADPDRAGRVAAGLAADGLAVVGADGRWHLPAGGGPGTGFRSAAAAR